MYPQLPQPISFHRLRQELSDLCAEVGVADFAVVCSPEVTIEHRQNARRYAQVLLDPDLPGPVFEFAAQTVWLPWSYRLGLYAHELGHVLDPDPQKTEEGADQVAREVLGVDIVYDNRWPGKGLQRAV